MRRAIPAHRPSPARRPHRGDRRGPATTRRSSATSSPSALGGDEVVSHLVHQETTFDHDVGAPAHHRARRSPRTRLVIAHADDHADERAGHEDVATATTETRAARGGARRHAHPRRGAPDTLPARARSGRELTLTLGLGRGQPARPRCRPPVATRTATPTTATRAPSPPTTSRCGSAPTPTARTPLQQALRLRPGAVGEHRPACARPRDARPTGGLVDAHCRRLRPTDWSAVHARVRPPSVADRARRCTPVRRSRPGFDAARRPARAVVVLVDGLGDELLRAARRPRALPALAACATAHRVTAGFPSTTATSMGTFGTGLPPGAHGLVGLRGARTRRPTGCSTSCRGRTDPTRRAWQPQRRPSSRTPSATGSSVTRVGPHYFDGSGLTDGGPARRPVPRGRRSLDDRVDAALAAVRATPRSLVYLYWGDLDKVGHVHGCQSWEWGDELECDRRRAARGSLRGLPDDTLVVRHRRPRHGRRALHDRGSTWPTSPSWRRACGTSAASRAPAALLRAGRAADVAAAWADAAGRARPASARARRPSPRGLVRSGAAEVDRPGSATSSSPCAAPSPSSTRGPMRARSCSRCSACTGR